MNNISQYRVKEKEIEKKRKKQAKLERTATKDSIVKICNNMRIFHLGRSVKEFTYISNKEGNRLKAHVPESLTQSDFRYFMQLLFVYIECTKPFVKELTSLDCLNELSEKYYQINLRSILTALGLTPGGRAYNVF